MRPTGQNAPLSWLEMVRLDRRFQRFQGTGRKLLPVKPVTGTMLAPTTEYKNLERAPSIARKQQHLLKMRPGVPKRQATTVGKTTLLHKREQMPTEPSLLQQP